MYSLTNLEGCCHKGGAISISAVLGSTVLLQELVFDRNVLRVPTDGRTTDVTVLLFTVRAMAPSLFFALAVSLTRKVDT